MDTSARLGGRHLWLRLALIAIVGLVSAALPLTAQQPADLVGTVSFRAIGPTAQGGRFVDFAVVEATPRVFYAATASGGLWKTENHGITWASIFDDQPVISIGAVAVSQSTPSVVYVGTGEANNSRSSYSGNGIYKSADAGATWTNVGLPNSQHIGRIVVHPTDANTVYVASLGPLYSDNDERGVYKTTDGGRTWTRSLSVEANGKHIGVVDVAMDPKNPSVLYAAAYDKVRRPWTFAEGGPGSAVYKTTDAGRTWTKLGGGLPEGLLGRIGLSVSRQDSNTVYAVIENGGPADDARVKRYAEGFGAASGSPAELYRSDDAGRTWRRVAPPIAPPGAAGGRGAGGGGGRGGGFDGGNPPYYYGQVRVDPNDTETVYVLSVGWSRSRDGGATWERMSFGGDNHALWIDPADSNHLILGHDHGMGVSFDGGANWFSPDNMPLAQYYAVGYDMDYPYNVYGGLQDNGSWKGPSTMPGGGSIPFEAWTRVGGGDGMYNVVDWKDSRWLYNESQFGPLQRVDQLTGESAGIRYSRPQGQPELRWNWNAPIVVSPHDSDVIYHGANVLLRSSFRGETWEEVSPDLTRNDPARQGGSGNIQYATLTTVSESPIVRGLIYVGTDDGNVQMTGNGGGTWTNLSDRLPGHQGYWISRVETSHHDPAVAYVTATGYRRDDFRPFVWKTSDYGQTWTSIAGNLPNEAVNVIREDHRNPDLLFVGTEPGVYASLDGGATWQDLRNNMPTNPVYDMQIHPRENELIVATHGRGIFVADITGLQGLTRETLASDAALLDVQYTVQWVRGQSKATAALNFAGESRASGAAIHYYLRGAASDVTVSIYDGARLIAELDAPGAAGLNTVRWNLQASRALMPGEQAGGRGRGGRGGFGGGFGRGGRGGGDATPVFPAAAPNTVVSEVQPGTYRVVLSVGGRQYEKPALVVADHWYRDRR
ncbi:MAG TPA: hypothetical protein VLA20_00710 [Vicinamibacterales bacterium]|nr:hypothetical protein [Vicinamibacterales bacterium]